MRKNLGFTLIEVMIAVTVLALGLMTSVFVVSEHTNTLFGLRTKTVGHWIIDLILTDVRIKNWQNIDFPLEDKGTRPYWGIIWEWHYLITTDKDSGIRAINIQVHPQASGEHVDQTIYLPAKIIGNQ